MPRHTPREDRKSEHTRPGRNLSARAKADRLDRENRKADAGEELARAEVRRRDAARPAAVVCPRGKVGWSEVVAAEKLAAYSKSDRPNRPVRIYLCPLCSAWHLTSSPAGTTKVAPPAPSFDPSRPAIPPPSKWRS